MINTEKYKDRLESEKSALESQLKDIARPDPSNTGSWEAIQNEPAQEADPNDQASSLDDYQENRAVVDVLNARHHDVVAALARIEDGTYGTCSVCGKAIETERLDADPAANTCKEHLS
jgi:RNA polymerase-binding transcription factor DksA